MNTVKVIGIGVMMQVLLLTSPVSLIQAQTTTSTEAERQEMLQQIQQLLELIQALEKVLAAKQAQEAEAVASAPEPIDRLVVTPSDHLRGERDAALHLVVYSDYDCPFCYRYHDTLKTLIDDVFSAAEVAWVQRHFPLTQLYPDAAEVARAAECVAEHAGNAAFWSFTDEYYEYRSAGPSAAETPSNVVQANVLERLDLNTPAVSACLASGDLAASVSADSDDAMARGVRGTPFTFVVADGAIVDEINGALPRKTVIEVIEGHLDDVQ